MEMLMETTTKQQYNIGWKTVEICTFLTETDATVKTCQEYWQLVENNDGYLSAYSSEAIFIQNKWHLLENCKLNEWNLLSVQYGMSVSNGCQPLMDATSLPLDICMLIREWVKEKERISLFPFLKPSFDVMIYDEPLRDHIDRAITNALEPYLTLYELDQKTGDRLIVFVTYFEWRIEKHSHLVFTKGKQKPEFPQWFGKTVFVHNTCAIFEGQYGTYRIPLNTKPDQLEFFFRTAVGKKDPKIAGMCGIEIGVGKNLVSIGKVWEHTGAMFKLIT